MTDPTLGELVRRIEESERRRDESTRDTNKRLDELIKEIRQERQEARTTYVQQAVYAAHREADHRRLGEIEDEQEATATFRRQSILSLTGVALGLLVTIVLFVIAQVTR